MNSNVRLGRIWGIPIGLNTSWFVVFALITWSLATNYFPREYPLFSTIIYLSLGLATSLLIFASVLAHEMGHAYLAVRNKIPVRGITLFIFGGVAQIEREPSTPGVEFRIAIAGPLVSLMLSGLFGALWLVGQGHPLLAAPSEYLMRTNFILAVFNLIPGFPLDGGRVLRALVWHFSGNYHRATQLASFTGQIVAFGFIGFGVVQLFTGSFVNGLWMIFIGWFLQTAAAGASSQAKLQRSLQGATVAQAMEPNCSEVAALTPLSVLVDQRVLSTGQHCFYVTDSGNILGMLTLRDITAIPKQKWGFTTAAQAMVPFSRLIRVESSMGLMDAMQAMDSANLSEIPVMDAGRLVGTLSRERILQFLRTRSQLGM